MEAIATTAKILGLAVGAGLNLYAAVLVTGLGIRFGWFINLPGELSLLAHPAVLVTAGILYFAEFLADKIPFLTPVWDGVHTVIRPIGGALLALGVTSGLNPTVQLLAMLGAGSVALGTHSSKMGIRLLAHATPEPVTHSILSIVEDISAVTLVALVFEYPYVALPILGVILIGISLLLPTLLRVAKFVIAGLSGQYAAWKSGGVHAPLPEWVTDPVQAVRVYHRSGAGVSAFREGYLLLSPPAARFIYRSWGRTRSVGVGNPQTPLLWGFVYNVVECVGGASFYVTKDWSAEITLQTFPAKPIQNEDYI